MAARSLTLSEPGKPCHAGPVDRATQRALNALNREFYAREAAAFSETRKQPWPGFERLLELGRESWRAASRERPRVLDVGSGDGRFGAFLADALRGELDFLGIDASVPLVARARARSLGPQLRFEHADLIETPLTETLPEGPFDLIALLGVLHHVPGRAARVELLRALAQRLAPGGLFAFTFWRLPDDARFASRVIPWREYNARATEPIAERELEPGDTLLRFGTSRTARYCHFADPSETENLVGCTKLGLRARFRADGRAAQLNEYVVLAAV